MKTPHTNRQGIALVLVLGFLVLITGLIIAFFISVTNDAASTRVSDGGLQSRQLTDTAVNAVMAQIRQATSGGTTVAWASQPGMIRTYKNTGSSGFGDPQAYYKLYSANNMTVSTADLAGFDPAADAITLAPGTTGNALVTDLNAPIKDFYGNLQYPIFDPAAVGTVTGFALPPGSPTVNEKAMAVRWQYVLKDGTVTTPNPDTSTNTTASLGTAAYNIPTSANPIVGRIAYWTDDETCKINVNTACGDDSTGGSYWDVPRVYTTYDQNFLSSSLPSIGEFQRFPGHPATVYLDGLFPGLTRKQYTDLAPRIGYGGSIGGTVKYSGETGTTPPPTPPLDSDRLYANLDEFEFNQARVKDNPPTSPASTAGLVTSAQVEQRKFFATASSRAPEVNLFNLPRVSMWPIYSAAVAGSAPPTSDADYQTPYDKLIMRCCTLGSITDPNIDPTRYYFRRKNSQSVSDDVSLNTSLFAYLQRLTGNPIPGYGGQFSAKYANRDQILVEMLDYIRSTNLYDSYLPEAKRYTHNLNTGASPTNSGDFLKLRSVGQVAPLQMQGQMGFGRFNTLSEAGLILSADAVSDASLGKQSKAGGPAATNLTLGQKIITAAFVVEPFSVAQGYYIMNNNSYWEVTGLENFYVRRANTGSETGVNYAQLFDSRTRTKQFTVGNNMWGDRSYGGVSDICMLGFYTSYDFLGNNVTVDGNSNLVVKYIPTALHPYVTIKIYTGTNATSVDSVHMTNGDLVQTINLSFPDSPAGGFPVPDFDATLNSMKTRFADVGHGGPPKAGGQNNLSQTVPPYTAGTWISDKDLQRSLVVSGGDIRQIANQITVPPSAFVPHANYLLTTPPAPSPPPLHAHSFQNGDSLPYGDSNLFRNLVAVSGAYGAEPTAPQARVPKFPVGTAQVTTGDFDNGVGRAADGPFINKPDEGVIGTTQSNQSNYFKGHTDPAIPGSSFFSPNRQIPSPGMFGSLPTGPWQTLLFRPDPAHPSTAKDPKDFLLMDLFWMPIVQPYAISEPFSTAGKINMNYQIVPFTGIKRTTAFEAALRGEQYLAISNDSITTYKVGGGSTNLRNPINVANMITQMNKRFGASNSPTKYDLYRSASEVCSLDLDTIDWSNYKLTGDNSRERPYAVLYQKLTTKSNTYTVHYRVQALKQNPTGRTDWTTWNEGKDQVLSENRGSSVIERYVDPNDPNLPNFLTTPTASLDSYYRFRVVSTKKFAP